jgi:hypothetical protein
MAFFIKKLNTHTIYVNGFRLVLNLATLPTRYLKVEGWTAAITFDFATSAILDIFAGVLIYIEARPFLEKSNRFSLGYVLPNLIAKVHIQRPWNWVCSIVTVGFFEAPLEPGRVRLRWQCVRFSILYYRLSLQIVTNSNRNVAKPSQAILSSTEKAGLQR